MRTLEEMKEYLSKVAPVPVEEEPEEPKICICISENCGSADTDVYQATFGGFVVICRSCGTMIKGGARTEKRAVECWNSISAFVWGKELYDEDSFS